MPEIEVACELEVVTHVTGPTDATAMEPDAVVGALWGSLDSRGTRGSRGNRGSRGTRGLMTGAKARGFMVYSNILSWHSGEQHRMVFFLVATA